MAWIMALKTHDSLGLQMIPIASNEKQRNQMQTALDHYSTCACIAEHKEMEVIKWESRKPKQESTAAWEN